MDVLWAPWRMEYIKSSPRTEGCVFCEKMLDTRDRDNLLLYRSSHTFVLMNPFPYNNGHLMVLPGKHAPGMEGLEDEELLDLMRTAQLCIDSLREAMSPEGFNAGINLGKVAGAGLADHLHLHIVPRWAGDASFMTVVGEVRVIPDHLLRTYDSLFEIFKRRGAERAGSCKG
ncbi:MAG: HIT domain-containing protein [Nitrospirae bacterium]|nr:HIT domain-containing protein [Nitrospirota bacterium]